MFSILLNKDNIVEYMGDAVSLPNGKVAQRVLFQFPVTVITERGKDTELKIYVRDGEGFKPPLAGINEVLLGKHGALRELAVELTGATKVYSTEDINIKEHIEDGFETVFTSLSPEGVRGFYLKKI